MAIAKPEITDEMLERIPKDGFKYELVDGEIVRIPCYLSHDAIATRLSYLLYPIVEQFGYLIGGNAGYRVSNGNLRCPDLSFATFEQLPDGVPDSFGEFAPALCMEIISDSEDRAYRMRKVDEYFQSGARQVWHLFPHTESLRVFRSVEDYTDYGPEQEFAPADILPGFRSIVGDLFAPPKPTKR